MRVFDEGPDILDVIEAQNKRKVLDAAYRSRARQVAIKSACLKCGYLIPGESRYKCYAGKCPAKMLENRKRSQKKKPARAYLGHKSQQKR